MDRAKCYRLLVIELEQTRELGYEALASRIGQPPVPKVVRVGQVDVTVEVTVTWANAKRRLLRVEATAFGPNWWSTERVTESINVAAPVPYLA